MIVGGRAVVGVVVLALWQAMHWMLGAEWIARSTARRSRMLLRWSRHLRTTVVTVLNSPG